MNQKKIVTLIKKDPYEGLLNLQKRLPESALSVSSKFFDRGRLLAYKICDDQFGYFELTDENIRNSGLLPTYYYSNISEYENKELDVSKKVNFLTKTYRDAFDQLGEKQKITRFPLWLMQNINHNHSDRYNAYTRDSTLAGTIAEYTTALSYKKKALEEYTLLVNKNNPSEQNKEDLL